MTSASDCTLLQILERSQKLLIEMAAPDAIARLPATDLGGRARDIWDNYFKQQQHSSLAAFLSHVLSGDDFFLSRRQQEGLFIQVNRESGEKPHQDSKNYCLTASETAPSPSPM